MQEPFKATRVYVNNAPTQYHVIFSDIIKQWGQPSICVCLTEEASIAVARALNLAAAQRGRNKSACETTRKAYARVRSLTVTTCQNTQQTTKETRHGWKS